jgi:hypothetical protein
VLNHIRTLLLNRPGPSISKLQDQPLPEYDELIPPDFTPSPDSAIMAAVRRYLFGADPDALFLNYRIGSIMMLLHASPWGRVITQKDPRITYPTDQLPYFDVFKTTVVTRPAIVASVTGVQSADEVQGRCVFQWSVEKQANGDLLVAGAHSPAGVTIPATDNLVLPGSSLKLFVSPTAPTAQRYLVTSVAKPSRSLGDIAIELLDTYSQPLTAELFAATDSELLQLAEQWRRQPTALCKLAVLFFAIARHTELQQGR